MAELNVGDIVGIRSSTDPNEPWVIIDKQQSTDLGMEYHCRCAVVGLEWATGWWFGHLLKFIDRSDYVERINTTV